MLFNFNFLPDIIDYNDIGEINTDKSFNDNGSIYFSYI